MTDGRADSALWALVEDGALHRKTSRQAALRLLSAWLSRNYRSEYIFKSTIANKLLFGKHSPLTTALLQEFRVGRSRVDSVLVNGSVRAFEIKTELDSPQKLAKQLEDYRTVFPEISVLTDESISHRYEDLLRDSPVGVMVLTRKDGSLSVRKPARRDTSALSTESMMRTLRKPEYSRIVRRVRGQVPSAPSGIYFATCLDSVADVPVEQMHELWADELRARKLRAPRVVASSSMRDIRHLCAEINPDEAGALKLQTWLSGSIA